MHKATFYPLGNADCCLLELANGRLLLFDFANTQSEAEDENKRLDLANEIRARLELLGRDKVDVLAITHFDLDHFQGVSEAFFLDHAKKYQSDERIRIAELWVPASGIVESREDLAAEGHIVQQEARHRFRLGRGIRVFSRPSALTDWLKAEGIDPADRVNLITDAGERVPGIDLEHDEVEFFVHSPFSVSGENGVDDRNASSLVLQAALLSDGHVSHLLLTADTPHDVLAKIVQTTTSHGNADRLDWDVIKLPHHCSYQSLSDEKGVEQTKPVPDVAALFEQHGSTGGIIVSTSDVIPTVDTTQPPHWQAANYYRDVARELRGEFVVTMEHPTAVSPEPMTIQFGPNGVTLEKRMTSGASAITSSVPPRSG